MKVRFFFKIWIYIIFLHKPKLIVLSIRQKRKLDEMYDQLRSEYDSVKRTAIQPARNFYSRPEPDFFGNTSNLDMMGSGDPIRKGIFLINWFYIWIRWGFVAIYFYIILTINVMYYIVAPKTIWLMRGRWLCFTSPNSRAGRRSMASTSKAKQLKHFSPFWSLWWFSTKKINNANWYQ